MRLLLLTCLCAAALPSAAQPDSAASLRVLSFNIRFNNPGDSLDAWPYRKEAVAGVVRFYEADIVGLQEAQRNQLADLEALLPGFAWFGEPRADGAPNDEYSAILYRTDRLTLLDHGTFWLSETPDVSGSRGWDADFPRIATWGRFRDRITDDTLYHFNTHFDHIGERARVESARLLRQRVGEIADKAPVIVTGDFNATPDSETYRGLSGITQDELIGTVPGENAGGTFTDAAEISAEPLYGPTSTWNGFDAIVPDRRIDYIFVRGAGVYVRKYGTLAETYDGVHYPSDHLPVLADIVVKRSSQSLR